ncbi:hypothetical protein SprV_0100479400 [Sparganum proliferum]
MDEELAAVSQRHVLQAKLVIHQSKAAQPSKSQSPPSHQLLQVNLAIGAQRIGNVENSANANDLHTNTFGIGRLLCMYNA